MSLDAHSQCFKKVLVTFTADKYSLQSERPGELILFQHSDRSAYNKAREMKLLE